MPCKVEKVTDHIVHLVYPSKQECGAAFLRFQEHYESPNPEFRGKVFTIGQYRDWYSREYGGNTYERDWGGFNLPSYVFHPFVQGLFDPLTEAEQEIVELVRYRTDLFYVIGSGKDSEDDVFDHELCHGLYYTDPKYKSAVDAVLDKMDLSEVKDHLIETGYCEEVLQDECHAYISASADYLVEQGIDVDQKSHEKLRKIKDKHFNAN